MDKKENIRDPRLGALVGDVAGSTWEFKNEKPSYDHPLFPKGSQPTDDTYMTCAVNEWLERNVQLPHAMRAWGSEHPSTYGGMFNQWLLNANMGPYNSFGNGSAMRASPCAYWAKTKLEALEYAAESAAVTHNHPEGIKGARTLSLICRMLLDGESDDNVLSVAEFAYPGCSEMSLSGLVEHYAFTETCIGTMPAALACFLASDGFEDCLRKSLMIGGDSDTLCAISCAMAASKWGVPRELAKKALSLCPADVKRQLAPWESF